MTPGELAELRERLERERSAARRESFVIGPGAVPIVPDQLERLLDAADELQALADFRSVMDDARAEGDLRAALADAHAERDRLRAEVARLEKEAAETWAQAERPPLRDDLRVAGGRYRVAFDLPTVQMDVADGDVVLAGSAVYRSTTAHYPERGGPEFYWYGDATQLRRAERDWHLYQVDGLGSPVPHVLLVNPDYLEVAPGAGYPRRWLYRYVDGSTINIEQQSADQQHVRVSFQHADGFRRTVSAVERPIADLLASIDGRQSLTSEEGAVVGAAARAMQNQQADADA